MPVYEYIALDAGGRRQKGIVDAGNMAAARQKLRETDVFPVEIAETADMKREETAGRGRAVHLFRKVGLRELSVMTRQLATLLGAGLPLVPSLSALVAQIRHPALRTTLARIREEVNEGNSLTQSMSHFPEVFPPFYINMVRAGEASGTVNLVLDRLADFNESQQALRMKIRSALAYPIFMFFIGSGVLFFLVTFVVPNITNIFREMHQTLPGVTVFLIVVSGFLKAFWWIIGLVLVAAIFGFRYAVRKTERGHYLWDVFKLNAPLFGDLNRKLAVARFSRTLGTLLQSGGTASGGPRDRQERRQQRRHRRRDRGRQRMSKRGRASPPPLSRSGFFPPIAVEMIAVGEQSGNMEGDALPDRPGLRDGGGGEYPPADLPPRTGHDPRHGGCVGFVVISVLLPIFEMNQLVR